MKLLLIVIGVIAAIATAFAIFVIALIIEPTLLLPLTEKLAGSGLTLATIALATGTFWLVFVTAWSMRNQEEQAKKDRRAHLLREVREWVSDIMDVTAAPITASNIAFVVTNTSLRYMATRSKAGYLVKAVRKVFGDADFSAKLLEVVKLLAAVMVLDAATNSITNSMDEYLEAFPGSTEFSKQLTKEREEQVALDKTNDDMGGKISTATSLLWKRYVNSLTNAESLLLDKLTDIESNLM